MRRVALIAAGLVILGFLLGVPLFLLVVVIVMFAPYLSNFLFIAGGLIFATGLLAFGERVTTLRGYMREQLWFRHPIWYTTEVLSKKSLKEWIRSGVILMIIGACLMADAILLAT